MKMDDLRAFVPAAIAAKIVAIEVHARRLGWPAALLFDSNLNDFGNPRGLAAALEPDDTIVSVQRGFITVRKNRLHVLKFPRG